MRVPPFICLLAVLLPGCTAPLPPGQAGIAPEMLLEARPLTGGVEPEPLPAADILALTDDMRRFVAQRLLPGGRDRTRLLGLLRALIHDAGFVIEYDERTYTAAEAFRLRRANCLAFTSLFVALAREAGLTVHYQEVDVPPDWSASGRAMIQNRHIDALVDLGRQREQIVDFNMADFRTSYDRRAITDDRARAHYYSNVGVERMEAGDPVRALQNFRKAALADPLFVPTWINLGALYRRAGHREWAEAAWQHALEISPRELVALSNLERLYREQGRLADADRLQGRLEKHRRQNPYYQYQLAKLALAIPDYEAAIAHLRLAISRKANEDRFYALLGFAYLQRGDPASAQRWMARAEELATDQAAKKAYRSKLELLRKGQEAVTPRGS